MEVTWLSIVYKYAKGGKEYLSNLKAANAKNFFHVDFAKACKINGC